MKIISRYIISTIVRFNLLVLLIVLGMEFFILLIAEFDDIGHGSYHLLQAMQFVLLSLPGNLYSLFPMTGLIGSLIGLGVLGSHSELVIMRSAGISVWQIILSVLKAALLLLIIITVLGEYVAPIAQQYANQSKVLAESSGQATESAGGIWFKSGNAFVNVQSVASDTKLQGITEYLFDDQQKAILALTAQSASLSDDKWQLNDAQISYFSEQGVKIVKQATMPWPVEINSRLLGITKNDANEMNLWQLYNYMMYRHRNGLSAGLYSLSFWQRLIQPLASLVMIFLAVPFIFGPLRSVTMGVRIVTGAVFGFAFYLLNEFFGPFSLVYQMPPVIGATLPTLLFIILAWYMMRRTR